jgi:hypothetical protein
MRVVLMLDFLYGNKDGRNPDFMKQMAEEGAGADMDALVSKVRTASGLPTIFV